jgi:UDP-N-acetylglucosamine 4,6-dehydratase
MIGPTLITGGSGFFGTACALELLERGTPRVCILSRSEYRQAEMRAAFNDPRLRFFVGDVRDVERLERAMHGVENVIHAAALKRVEVGEYDSAEMAKTNVLGTMNVVEAATRAGVMRVVGLSSDKACEPVNCYGASKLVGEKLLLAANNARGHDGPIFAAVRYGNVAGSTGSVIPVWRRALEHAQPVTLTHPEATRFWMHVSEAVDLVLDTLQTMRGGELAIPDLPAYRLADLAQAMGVKYHITGLRPGEKMHESMRPGESSLEARRMSIEELQRKLADVH